MSAANAAIEVYREQRTSFGEPRELGEREPGPTLLRAIEPDAELRRDPTVPIDSRDPLGIELLELEQGVGEELEQERRTERHGRTRVRDVAQAARHRPY